jgi:hypothetical protein
LIADEYPATGPRCAAYHPGETFSSWQRRARWTRYRNGSGEQRFRGIFGGRSFMVAMCVAVDPATGRATVVGAGHPPVLIAATAAAPNRRVGRPH